MPPTDDATYEQYCQARVACGFDPDFAMVREVWERCELDARRDMLAQLVACEIPANCGTW